MLYNIIVLKISISFYIIYTCVKAFKVLFTIRALSRMGIIPLLFLKHALFKEKRFRKSCILKID